MTLPSHRSRVVVAMSGGVDSSVAAALLKEQGFDVIGVTMHIWAAPACGTVGGRGCCGYEAIDDARRVAHKLCIPHYVFDFRKEFERAVIADFCSEYARGRTPNPCIRCNKYLKFDVLLKKAKGLGADFIATGHYARIEEQGRGTRDEGRVSLPSSLYTPHSNPLPQGEREKPRSLPQGEREKAHFLLKRPKDRAKDQTYFLYFLKQRQLSHILFPLGDLTKSEVREHARKLGLIVADKKESQEVCFAPRGTYPEFLKARFPELARPGPILDTSGKVIGRHNGIIHYTIGQRRRIGIARAEPLYVTGIDPVHNSITVGYAPEAFGSEMKVTNPNWISRARLAEPLQAQVQIRYQSQPIPALITPQGSDSVHVKLDSPQWAITPGQAAVFYDGDAVLGGGTIELAKEGTANARE